MLLITDANIFMDLEKIGLLEYVDSLSFKFATSDFVFNELNSQQQALVSSLNVEKYEIDANEIGSFYQEFSDLGQLNISYQDYSIFYHAKKCNGVVLSNDKRLRNFSKVRSIPVKGLFYILDEFVIQEIVTPKIMIENLKLLKKINHRLPLNEIDKRIKKFNEL
jgi:rRNA-processing protein FCF1